MTSFSATVTSAADVGASRERVWKVLTDPAALTRLTPLLTRIDADGSTWVWRMAKVSALGAGITPVFTEKMTFTDATSIDFTHAPPAGGPRERIGVEGRYDLSDTKAGGDTAHLSIRLTVNADLPLPGAAKPAVTRVMKQTMSMMGDRFAKNLLRELHA